MIVLCLATGLVIMGENIWIKGLEFVSSQHLSAATFFLLKSKQKVKRNLIFSPLLRQSIKMTGHNNILGP